MIRDFFITSFKLFRYYEFVTFINYDAAIALAYALSVEVEHISLLTPLSSLLYLTNATLCQVEDVLCRLRLSRLVDSLDTNSVLLGRELGE